MVDVEHGALGALCQHVLALCQQLVYLNLCVGELEAAHILYACHPLLLLLGDVVVGIVQVSENLLVTCLQLGILLLKILKDVAHAQTDAACLVAVSRTDALACRAHLSLALCCLVCTVEHTVSRQDEMRTLGNVQAVLQRVAGVFKLFCLKHEKIGSYHASVSDDVYLVFCKNARRN